jgi:hypothetical protein
MAEMAGCFQRPSATSAICPALLNQQLYLVFHLWHTLPGRTLPQKAASLASAAALNCFILFHLLSDQFVEK